MKRRTLTIESEANPTFKKLRSLLTAKGLRKEGLCLISGDKIGREKRANPELQLLSVIRSNRMKTTALRELFEGLPSEVTEIELADPLFQELDELGTHSPLLLLKTEPFRQRPLTQKPEGVELVCPVGDPRNLGAIARSAKAFGVKRLLLTKESAHPFLPRALKASSGALLDLKIEELAAPLSICLQSWSENPDFTGLLFGLDLHGSPLRQWSPPPDLLLVCGEEGKGLPATPGLQLLHIPIEGVESLNAGTAMGITLYELSFKLARHKTR